MIQPYGPSDARLMIVADCVSYRDIQSNSILDNREFDKMLSEAGAVKFSCFVTSLIRDLIPGQNIETQIALTKREITLSHKPMHNKHVLPSILSGTAALIRDIELVKPKIILALGNGPLFALTGKWGINSWRGSLLSYTSPEGHHCYVIPTYTPSYIQAVWRDRNTAIQDIRKAWSLTVRNLPIEEPKYDFLIEPSFTNTVSTLNLLLQHVGASPTKLSVDIETRGGHIACLGIAWSETEAICIPQIRATFDVSRLNYWGEEEETFITHLLYKLLTHPNAEVIGQNFIYDAQYFYRHFHFIPNFVRDTMLAQHSIFSNMPKSLDYLSSLYSAHHVYWKDDSKNWDPKLGERQLWVYNCVDCVRTFEIDTQQQLAIDSLSETWLKLRSVHDFQQSMFWPVLASMNLGLRVDESSKSELSSELAEAIKIREAWMESVIGHPLNIKSPKQMTDFFYRELAQKPVISRKTRNPTCDDSALETIGNREPLLRPLLEKVGELRSLGVFRSTFLEAPLDVDNRIRCSYNIAGTETYRFSSAKNAFGSGMNLQNIPSGDEDRELPNVRKLFLADPGMEFFDIDLDSADLRIVAWESDCLEMKQMFSENLKPYVEIAKEYYRDPTITKYHPSYALFKALCHGTNYLGTPSGLSAKIGLVVSEVERIQKWYYQKFPEIKHWQDSIIQQVNTRRFVENVFGYRMYIFDRIEGTIYNQAIAWVPQSTVGCLINRGYLNIHRHEPMVQVLLQVHDSLAGQYPTHLRDEAQSAIIRHCSVPLPYPSGELIIPVGVKTSEKSWGDCHE